MSIRTIIIAIGFGCVILSGLHDLIEKQPKSIKYGAIVLFITFILSFMMPDPSRLPVGALEYHQHHYYIFEGDVSSWREAQNKCNERGGYLAVIDDVLEDDALFAYMKKMDYDLVYFGLAQDSKGDWKYLYSDHSSGYKNWGYNSDDEREPNNKDGGSHAALDTHMHDGHWNDAEFGRQVYTPDGDKYKNKAAYICEWDY